MIERVPVLPMLEPLPEWTQCQQLIQTALDPWYTTLIVLAILALIGGVCLIEFATKILLGLSDRLGDWIQVRRTLRKP